MIACIIPHTITITSIIRNYHYLTQYYKTTTAFVFVLIAIFNQAQYNLIHFQINSYLFTVDIYVFSLIYLIFSCFT